MAYMTQTAPRSRFAEMLAALRQNRARRAEYLRVRGELEMLSNRELSDIGISRADIERVARSAMK
ncbi:DUF1127 domain-containing protein [Palleronia sediminis]|uniref:DUF1127 domain-containing protein n=1 Tax=Palleronia sediminis TaxID=2547833 RepID=A0A4R6AGK7_9RHOB|nr:DUF1127 domain-containing protein [Palleronia sediminis]TDL81588.1 DUF1127 domain-containing protein [Palleronia sediminis]